MRDTGPGSQRSLRMLHSLLEQPEHREDEPAGGPGHRRQQREPGRLGGPGLLPGDGWTLGRRTVWGIEDSVQFWQGLRPGEKMQPDGSGERSGPAPGPSQAPPPPRPRARLPSAAAAAPGPLRSLAGGPARLFRRQERRAVPSQVASAECCAPLPPSPCSRAAAPGRPRRPAGG